MPSEAHSLMSSMEEPLEAPLGPIGWETEAYWAAIVDDERQLTNPTDRPGSHSEHENGTCSFPDPAPVGHPAWPGSPNCHELSGLLFDLREDSHLPE